MCGILGGNNEKWNYKDALNTITHRGPNGKRIVNNNEFTLGFVRLSIIDLSENGMQPMKSVDDNVQLVFNGEIYGFKRLRSELIELGYQFKSESDTEVVLAAYLLWGKDFINKIDGMFSIAIMDKRKQELLLYRDRFGIKPLFYYSNGADFAFASEIKAIIALSKDLNLEVDNTSIYDYLNFRYIPEPKTLYKKIFKLLPGYELVFDLRKHCIISNRSYWQLKVNSQKGSVKKRETIIEDIRYLISESVRDQLVSDVPVGTLLSGGVDSSIISYKSNQISGGIETFSIGFEDKDIDETKYINYFLSKYPMPSNRKIFKCTDIKDYYYDIKKWYDEPFADDSAYPTYLVSKLAKDKVTVVLTGDGSDEIFGGYARYNRMWKNDNGSLPDYSIIQREYGENIDSVDLTWREYLGIDKDYDRHWLIKKYYNPELPPITRCQVFDMYTYLPGDILTKVDRASMQVSLETRVPFLSKKIVEYAFSLTEDDRCPSGKLKGILKEAYSDVFGEDFLNRKKQGFGIPNKYFVPKMTKQEELLRRVWNIGNDNLAKERSELDIVKEYSDKHLSMVKLYDTWLAVKQSGKRIDKYLLANNISRIAIYGMGIIGERLFSELKLSEVKVIYAIDKNASEMLYDIEVIKPDDVILDVDAIIVTSSYYFVEIENKLILKTKAKIINLEELLYEIIESEREEIK